MKKTLFYYAMKKDKYFIRLAEAEDIERIQQLSQELMEYEKNNSTKKHMFNMNWALTEQGYNNYKSTERQIIGQVLSVLFFIHIIRKNINISDIKVQ